MNRPQADADKWFSRLIRLRGRCENCGKTSRLECAHGFSRRYGAIRWDERNAFCLCSTCHARFTGHPLEWEAWMKERLGERVYEELRGIALWGEVPHAPTMVAALKREFLRLSEDIGA